MAEISGCRPAPVKADDINHCGIVSGRSLRTTAATDRARQVPVGSSTGSAADASPLSRIPHWPDRDCCRLRTAETSDFITLPAQRRRLCSASVKRILLFTAPQFTHSNLWTARSRRVGCRVTPANSVGLRHFGQVSSITRSKDMLATYSEIAHRRYSEIAHRVVQNSSPGTLSEAKYIAV